MPRFRLSPLAEQDLESILGWTHRQFGEEARLRYEALIVQAIVDIGADPERPGCSARPELAANVLTYHLGYSRDHVVAAAGRVRNPRHFLLYRITSDGWLEIGRILHDSMDLQRLLPPGFGTPEIHPGG